MFLDELGDVVRRISNRIVICGDFNSKSTLWGSLKTNERGDSVG